MKILPDDNANSIPFSYLCKTFSSIRSAKGLDKASQALNADIKRKLQGQSPYPYIRLLLPGLDRERQAYGVGPQLYAKWICKVESLPRKDIEAIRHWTDSDMNTTGKFGDLPSTVEAILSSRKGSEFSGKTIGDVNSLLDDLAKADENAEKMEIVRRISKTFSPVEHKWIMRILFKDLNIGCGEKSILKHWHQDAEKAYYQWMDLRKLCSEFINLKTSERIASNVKPGCPFVPMLSARVPITDIIKLKKFKLFPFVMEIKIDGERMLCHKMGDRVMWLTRRGNCYNKHYGDALSPFILSSIDVHTVILDGEIVSWDEDSRCMLPFGTNKRTAIIEGQYSDGGPGPKQQGGTFLFYIVFDVVYLSGERSEKILDDSVRESPIVHEGTVRPGSLMGLPLDIRRRVLRKVMTEERHRLEFAKDFELWDGDPGERNTELEEFFTEMAILQHEEGIIVKSLKSMYVLGEMGRETKDWIKVKPDYSDLTPSLDCLIVVVYFSESMEESKRSGLVNGFLLAILEREVGEEDPNSPTTATPTFLTCGKVGSGLPIDELKSLTKQFETNWTKKKPGNVIGKEIADRWISHDQSIVLEVNCFDFIDSTKPGAKWNMRFPRVKSIRRDKLWKDADTVQSVSQIRLGKRKLINGDDAGEVGHFVVDVTEEQGEGEYSSKQRIKQNKKKDFSTKEKVSERMKRGMTIAKGFGLESMDGIEVNSNLLVVRCEDGINTRSLKICIYAGRFIAEGEEWETRRLQRLVHELGGENRANPVDECDYVLVGSQDDLRTSNIFSRVIEGNTNVDIVDFRWLLQIDREKEYKAPTWGQHRAMCKGTEEIFQNLIDAYGDNFYEPVCPKELKCIIDRMPHPPSSNEPWQHMVLRTWNSEDMWVFDCKMNSLWRNPGKIYINCYTTLGVQDRGESERILDDDLGCLYLAISHVEKHGGIVEKWLSPQVTHVIVDDFLHKRLSDIKKRIRELALPPHRQHTRVVTWGWVFASINAGNIIDPPSNCLVNLSKY